MVHLSACEWEDYVNDVVQKDWLFVGATICDLESLHVDYAKRLVEFNLKCHAMAGEEVRQILQNAG